MQAVSTETLIHVGIELVVIGGLTYWLNRRISSLEDTIAAQDKKIHELINVANAHDALIGNVYRSLKLQLPKIHVPQQTQKPQQPPTTYENSQTTSVIPKETQQTEHEESDLDAGIKSELDNIVNNRKQVFEEVEEEEELPEECDNDTCCLES